MIIIIILELLLKYSVRLTILMMREFNSEDILHHSVRLTILMKREFNSDDILHHSVRLIILMMREYNGDDILHHSVRLIILMKREFNSDDILHHFQHVSKLQPVTISVMSFCDVLNKTYHLPCVLRLFMKNLPRQSFQPNSIVFQRPFQ